MRYFVFILIFITFFGSVSITNAQFNVVETQVNLNLIPENPGPNEIVQVEINSYATNLNSAKIKWVVNGKVIKNGIGEKIIQFTTGDTGTKTTLTIEIQTSEGEIINKSFSVNPANLDIIWQSSGFIPPFYKGKALFSHQNSLTIIAIPHISSGKTEISHKNVIYTWKKDGKVMESDSGYGRNTFTFQGNLISRPIKIEVTAKSVLSDDSAYAHTTITPVDPDLVFYKKNPLYGIEFQKALTGNISLDDINEINIVAIPYFFGVADQRDPDLDYKWSINGALINTATNESQIFRKKDGTTGSSLISLSIENRGKILQYASNSFKLMFSEQKRSSL